MLAEKLISHFQSNVECATRYGQIELVLGRETLSAVCLTLRDHPDFAFDTLIDICGVDYFSYGQDHWETQAATENGFSRGIVEKKLDCEKCPKRFAVVYQLLSVELNQRVRLKVFLESQDLKIPSVIEIWPSANWYEREAFDLYGIVFKNHPDLRRLLTDYGFQGHPMRKDFPRTGHLEVRYDEIQKRIIYEPVSIESRDGIPKVIREDNRYV